MARFEDGLTKVVEQINASIEFAHVREEIDAGRFEFSTELEDTHIKIESRLNQIVLVEQLMVALLDQPTSTWTP